MEVITQAGEAHGEGGGGDNNEERMEQLLQRVVNCGARQIVPRALNSPATP